MPEFGPESFKPMPNTHVDVQPDKPEDKEARAREILSQLLEKSIPVAIEYAPGVVDFADYKDGSEAADGREDLDLDDLYDQCSQAGGREITLVGEGDNYTRKDQTHKVSGELGKLMIIDGPKGGRLMLHCFERRIGSHDDQYTRSTYAFVYQRTAATLLDLSEKRIREEIEKAQAIEAKLGQARQLLSLEGAGPSSQP